MQKIPSGYKQTEIGTIPADWDVKRLGDIADINMGQSPDSKNYNLTGHGIPLIQGNADIKNRKSIERVWTTQITKTCKAGDLIMTVRAPVGFIGIASENSCIGRGVCSFRAKKIEKDFLYHSLIFNEGAWKILEQGSTFTAANSNQIIGFELFVPPTKAEQLAIGIALSDGDTLIKKLEKLIEKKKNIKQGVMQELLTSKLRLPGFSGKWETKKLGEVVDIKKGQLITDSTRIDGRIPVIAGGKTAAYFHDKANRFGKTITISGSGASAGYVAFRKPNFCI
jgi:type I restriction enzyme S subunit